MTTGSPAPEPSPPAADGHGTVRTVAFIGLGVMGGPMAVNLVRAGFDVRGFNRSPAKGEALEAAGGTAYRSIREAVEGAEVVCVMVPGSADVESVLLGEDGVLASAAPGTVVVDFSSIRPTVARELAQAAEERGMRLLDAPVSGGEAGAVAGTLSVMAGGDDEAFERARPVLEAVGRTIGHVGPSGAGQTVKAANQLVVAAHLQVLAEAVVFLEAYGVELDPALDVLGGGLAGSAVLEQKRELMRDREFVPGARMALHHKDLGAYLEASRAAGVASPVGALLGELVAAAMAAGDQDLDHSALLRGVERLSGRLP